MKIRGTGDAKMNNTRVGSADPLPAGDHNVILSPHSTLGLLLRGAVGQTDHVDNSSNTYKPEAARISPRVRIGSTRSLGLGLLIVLFATAASLLISNALPTVSPLVLAIALGVVLRNARVLPQASKPGIDWATKRLLRAGIVFLGLRLSFPQILSLEVGELATIFATVTLTFILTWWIGVKIGVGRSLSMLMATGFSICGASAVAAMSAVSTDEQNKDEDVATAVAMVTLFGTLTIVLLPMAQSSAGLNDHQMGIWIGSSVHEVAQVVAAASIVSTAALTVAVVVKLGRVVMLAPLIAILGAAERARAARLHVPNTSPTTKLTNGKAKRAAPLVPLFVVGFLVMAAVRSTELVPVTILDASEVLTSVLLTAAMFGLGTGVHVPTLIKNGGRATLLGLISTLIAVATSLAGIHLLT